MHITRSITALLICNLALSVSFAQEPQRDENTPPGTAHVEPFYKEIEKMPEDFAEDFPLYSPHVKYFQYGKIYDPMEIRQIREDAYNNNPGGRVDPDSVPLYRVFSLAHAYTGTTPEEIRKWYRRNAFNAGYEEILANEAAMRNMYELRYEKRTNDILKQVVVMIDEETITLMVFQDREIEETPEFIDKPEINPVTGKIEQSDRPEEPENN